MSAGNLSYVFLNPDGTMPFGLVVIVHAPTGVVYGHQCAGLATDMRHVEGFLVPICLDQRFGSFDRTMQADYHLQVMMSFGAALSGTPPASGDDWPAEILDKLEYAVADLVMWRTTLDGHGDARLSLQLDRSRLAELTEAWVPVITPYGPGTLLFENSD